MNVNITSRAWWRAASAPPRPDNEAIQVSAQAMRSSVTVHHADYVGEGMWQVDYLRGAPVTRSQALSAMRIAATVADRVDIDPDQLNHLWADAIGMTAREAVGYTLMSLDPEPGTGVDRERDWGLDR